jgi:hypothetical protein
LLSYLDPIWIIQAIEAGEFLSGYTVALRNAGEGFARSYLVGEATGTRRKTEGYQEKNAQLAPAPSQHHVPPYETSRASQTSAGKNFPEEIIVMAFGAFVKKRS